MRKPITVAWVNTIRKKLNNNVEGFQEKRKTTLQMIHNLENPTINKLFEILKESKVARIRSAHKNANIIS